MSRYKVVGGCADLNYIFDSMDMSCETVSDMELLALRDAGVDVDYLDLWLSDDFTVTLEETKLKLLYPKNGIGINKLGILSYVSSGEVCASGLRGIFLETNVRGDSPILVLDDTVGFITFDFGIVLSDLTLDITKVSRPDLLYQAYLIYFNSYCKIKDMRVYEDNYDYIPSSNASEGLVKLLDNAIATGAKTKKVVRESLYKPIGYMFASDAKSLLGLVHNRISETCDSIFESSMSAFINNTYSIGVIGTMVGAYDYFMHALSDIDVDYSLAVNEVSTFFKQLSVIMYRGDYILVRPLFMYIFLGGKNIVIYSRVNRFLEFLKKGEKGVVQV